MFIQVIQGHAINPDGIHAELDRWKAELQPGATGWLGSTAGVTDDGRFIAVVRFESEELARRNSDRPEQGAWWHAAAAHLAEVVFHNSPRVHTYQGGAEHAEGAGDFTQTVYFTSEADGRQFERERPADQDPAMAELFGLMSDLRYFDLRDPWLDSPRVAS